MENINTLKFVKSISKKLKGIVRYKDLLDIYTIVAQYMYTQILNNRSFTIENFGTFSRRDWKDGRFSIYFKPNDSVVKIIKSKRKLIKIIKKDKSNAK